MNRSILIVICDFLLVSLLAFSTVDINKTGQSGGPPKLQMTPAAKQVSGPQDLGEVMRLALEDERTNREQLVAELTRTRTLVNQQEQQIQSVKGQLQSKEQAAAELEQQIQSMKSQLQSKEQVAAGLQQQQALLERQFATAQTNLAKLNDQLHARTVETVISKEQRAAMEAEARKQSEAAAALGKELSQLQERNKSMQTEQQAMRNQLLLSEESNRSARAQISRLKEEVDVQRGQNVRLAEGVKDLASKSSELAQEIRSNRELTPNFIFSELATNRVLASFAGQKPGFFGIGASKDEQTRVILVTDETNTFVLCHVQDTPLRLSIPGTQWDE
jgi:hypothetical protein